MAEGRWLDLGDGRGGLVGLAVVCLPGISGSSVKRFPEVVRSGLGIVANVSIGIHGGGITGMCMGGMQSGGNGGYHGGGWYGGMFAGLLRLL